jgi:hypothetical protein
VKSAESMERVKKQMGESKNTLNTTPKNMDRLDTMIIFSVLIVVMIFVCVSLMCRGKISDGPLFWRVLLDSLK